MEIPPVYWTLIGEIVAVIIVVLIAVIAYIFKDREKIKDYTLSLKKVISKLKKKLQESEENQVQERALVLLNALVAHVREQYQVLYGNDIEPSSDASEADDSASVEKIIFIAGFQTMIAELSALENSNEPEVAWGKITKELTPLFENYLGPFLPQSNELPADDDLKRQLENAGKHIENLEKFKQLYFDLQTKLRQSVVEIESSNQEISELSAGGESNDAIQLIIEKNKELFLEMGQIIGMDKDLHHDSVANKMDYSDTIINERKDEINRLKSQVAKQFEEIWALQSSLSEGGAASGQGALDTGIENLSRNLKDAEMCIETMDMEIQTLTSEISNLKSQLKEQSGTDSETVLAEQNKLIEDKEKMTARFEQESKELMSCITGLENSNLEQNKKVKELEEKYSKLEAEYSSLKAKSAG